MKFDMDNDNSMMKFFANLKYIAQHLRHAIENGEALPEGAAEAVSEFNKCIQELEMLSQEIRRKQ